MIKLKFLLLTLLSAIILTACGGNADDNTDENTGGKEGEKQQLIISTFGLSEDIVQKDVFEPFEKENNAEIVVETGTGSERYTKFKNNPKSNIDIIELSQANASEGFTEGLFEKLDATKVPNIDQLIPPAKGLTENGSGPAYAVNSIGIIYNEKAAGMKIAEWSDLWDPSLKGKISIPDIATTFGPAMVYIASEHKGADIETDKGKAAFEGLEELSPNIVKTYSKSSDLANMFQSGEIVAAVVADFAIPLISEANPDVQYVVPESGTYANFNMLNVNENSKNKELAHKFINWRISQELQEVTAKSLNEAPTNVNVKLDEEVAKNKTYGKTAERAKSINFEFVNENLKDWINQWNRTLNQ